MFGLAAAVCKMFKETRQRFGLIAPAHQQERLLRQVFLITGQARADGAEGSQAGRAVSRRGVIKRRDGDDLTAGGMDAQHMQADPHPAFGQARIVVPPPGRRPFPGAEGRDVVARVKQLAPDEFEG